MNLIKVVQDYIQEKEQKQFTIGKIANIMKM